VPADCAACLGARWWAGAAMALAGAAAQAEPRVYTLDPEHSFVHFEVLHFGTSTLRGRFGPVRGQVSLDHSTGHGYVGLTLQLDSLDTGFKPLDARLLAPDLLDATTEPLATFVASDFRFEGARLRELRGELTLRGKTVSISLLSRRFGCRPEPPHSTERCGGDFEATLRRSDFGATFGLPFVADPVRLLIQVEGLAP
jgi:polyisoprenoid-binding protein YceI